MDKYTEFVNPYHPTAAPLFVRAEHLARYLYAAGYIRKHGLKSVLDCACGDGYGCRILARHAEHVTGAERDAARVAEAFAADGAQGVRNTAYHTTDLNLGLSMVASGCVDCVTCFETLEHVEKDGDLVDEFRRALRRGGRLLLSVPKAGYEKADAAGRPENPYHLRLYEPDRLKGMLEAHGFAVESELGQPYANAARLRAENYLRDTGKSHADIGPFFSETPEALEFYARVWAWPEAELPEKSNTMFLVCRKKA